MCALCASNTYCATCALVRITPRWSMMTPEPEMGDREPELRGVQRIFTSAGRVMALIDSKGTGAYEYGFLIRKT